MNEPMPYPYKTSDSSHLAEPSAPTICCSTGVPGVTQIDNAGPTSSETPDGCHRCGGRGNLGPYTAGFRAGYQQAQLDTYTPNILATQRREQAEAERQRVRRYGE